MYRRFTKISVTLDTPVFAMGPGCYFWRQNVGFYYFVLNRSKRFRGGNTALTEGVKMACGTPVVHFPSRVVHAFSCTTKPEETVYHP